MFPEQDGKRQSGDYEAATVGARRRTRLAVRRWRLWWRFQLRTLRWRGPFRRLRLLRHPGEDVFLTRAQLLIGRRLGTVYLRVVRLAERTRIARARVPDRSEPARTTLVLLRLQRGLLAGLVLLIVVGLGLDALSRAVGGDVSRAIGIAGWLRRTFHLPDDDTLRALLAATAGGAATILGLVISISLIVWQTTADRYRSSSIVGFLLRERLGAAVVRLLALSFAYSLWVLALLQATGRPPYVSAALALGLSTVAVLSLISYRQAGLVGYLPVNIANSLCSEILREQHRAARRGAGRSVADFSRRVVSGNLQILDDLLTRLLREGDSADVAACVDALGRALSRLVRRKSTLDRGSLFFERDQRRFPAAGLDIAEQIVSEGLMNPTTDVPDHVWVEKRVLQITERVVESDLFLKPSVAERVFTAWAESLQYAWFVEDYAAMELILNQVERVGADVRILAHPGIIEHVTTIAWVLVEAVGRGVHTTSADIVDAKPWKSDAGLTGLSWQAREDARELGQRIRREIAVTGGVTSPRWAMLADVDQRRGPRLRAQQGELTTRSVTLCRGLLARAADQQSPGTHRAAKMTIRVLLRLVHHGLEMPPFAPLASTLANAAGQVRDEDADELRSDAGLVSRWFNSLVVRVDRGHADTYCCCNRVE